MITVQKLNPTLDITQLIEKGSFLKEENLTSQVDVLKFKLKKFGTRSYRPQVTEEIEVYDGATKIFGGVISKIKKEREGIYTSVYEVEVKDYTHLLDRQLVPTDYENKSPEYIINDILTNYTDGSFTQINVAVTGITIEFIKFDYVQPSKALQELAELIGYDWYVDYNKDIHFFSKAIGETAPWDITDTNGYAVDNSLEIKIDDSQLRNTIYVRGGEYVGSSRADKVGSGDGTTNIFKLPYRYDIEPSVTVGGVAQTVGVDFIDSEDSYDCLWNYNEKIIKFKTAPASGDVVVTGSPLIVVLIKAQDNASVAANGKYEFRIVDKKIKTKEAARMRAQAEMTDYANKLEEASFVTYTTGLKSGMRINIYSDILNENKSFIVNKIQTTIIDSGNNFEYKINLVTQRTLGIIDFLQKQIAEVEKRIGVMRQENEVLDTIVDIQGIDIISVVEAMNINQYVRTFLETNIPTESLLNAGIDDPPIWVAGAYSPTGAADRKRVPRATRSCLLAS
ncbi:MAG: hypothetical protein P1P85_04150 [Patescibacteria group bacterium]|nr:hypothetical protein [Patescibacteria group bacterium]